VHRPDVHRRHPALVDDVVYALRDAVDVLGGRHILPAAPERLAARPSKSLRAVSLSGRQIAVEDRSCNGLKQYTTGRMGAATEPSHSRGQYFSCAVTGSGRRLRIRIARRPAGESIAVSTSRPRHRLAPATAGAGHVVLSGAFGYTSSRYSERCSGGKRDRGIPDRASRSLAARAATSSDPG